MSIFDPANRPGRDQATEWFKFEKIGDKIGGTILDIFYKPAQGIYKEQRCFTIKSETGEVLNVGIKMNGYTLPRTDTLEIGDELGLSFDKEVPSKTPGVSQPAKSITIFSKINLSKPRTGQNASKLGSINGAVVTETPTTASADDTAF